MKYRFIAIALGAITALLISAVLPSETTAVWAGQAAGQVGEEDVEERRRRGVRRLGDVVAEGDEEWSLDIPAMDMPQEVVEAQPEVTLPDAQQDARLQSLLARRAFAPDDTEIQAELDALLDEAEADGFAAFAAGDLATTGQIVSVLQQFDPGRGLIAELQAELARLEQVNQLLAQAQVALEAGRIVAPADTSAVALFEQVLEIEPGNSQAEAGMVQAHEALVLQALELAGELDFEGAEAALIEAEQLRSAPEMIAEARESIAEFRERHTEELFDQADLAIDEGRYDDAEDLITQLVALGEEEQRIERLRRVLADAILYGSFEPGQVMRDPLRTLGEDGPAMVIIPAGNFMMGSPDNEPDRSSNEGPRFRVTFNRGFAMARTETTVAEFARFVEATGYVTDAERGNWSRIYDADLGRIDRRNRITWRNDYMGGRAGDDDPVIHVSWNDAYEYARWLAQETDRPYRLPSEAEFEYALRAGSQTRYWWGDGSPQEVVENLTGDGDISTTRRRWTVAFRNYSDGYWGPAPVASFQSNPFGLYDMGGNVMEWVEDCWHDSFVRAPTDGSAWVNPGCDRRVIKGGAWSSSPAMSRSAFRLASGPDGRDARVGFRVARDL